MNLNSPGLRDVVLLDLLNAPYRDNAGNLVICGSPGRGKSHVVKNLTRSWLKAGAGIHLFDPTDAREHETALADVADKLVIDVARMSFSLDGLRIFPFHEAAERTVDHLLPQLGLSSLSRGAQRLWGLLSPESREANGIGSTAQLMRYLRQMPTSERTDADTDLLIGLEGLAAQRLLRPLVQRRRHRDLHLDEQIAVAAVLAVRQLDDRRDDRVVEGRRVRDLLAVAGERRLGHDERLGARRSIDRHQRERRSTGVDADDEGIRALVEGHRRRDDDRNAGRCAVRQALQTRPLRAAARSRRRSAPGGTRRR